MGPLKHKSHGFTLVEAMIALGITSILLLSMSSIGSILYSYQTSQTVMYARNEVAGRIRTMALTPGVLESSAVITNALGPAGVTPAVGAIPPMTRFDRLLKCHTAFTGTGQSGCDRTEMDDPSRGNFFYLSDRNSPDPNLTLAGESVHYTRTARRCTQEEAQDAAACPIFARVWAEPYCLNFAPSCNKAMSIAVRYMVGIRQDANLQIRPMGPLEGELVVGLQKGIQITRVLDHTGTPLAANQAGIIPVEKYLGLADQNDNPQALQFEVLVENASGLSNIRLQMRALTGPEAAGLDDQAVPTSLLSKEWLEIANPDSLTPPWSLPVIGTTQNQLLNFGASNTTRGFLIGARFDLPNNDPVKMNYLYHLNADGTAWIEPQRFKSGLYQFRTLATDSMGGTVESTNLVTVRIFSRPQLAVSGATPLPTTSPRTCGSSNSSVAVTVLVADDEGLREAGYKILDSSSSVIQNASSSASGTNTSFTMTLDKSRPRGDYTIVRFAKGLTTGMTVNGSALPETTIAGLFTLEEVTPTADILFTPSKVRVNSQATAAYNFVSGTCCDQTPTLAWSFPAVPEAGGVVMLAQEGSAPPISCSDSGNGLRTCSSTITVKGVVAGPATAARDIDATVSFSGGTNPACEMQNNRIEKYLQVVQIPGIQFMIEESLWIETSNIKALTTSMKAQDRNVRIKIDFPPEGEPVTVAVRSSGGSIICDDIIFPAGTGFTPVYRTCPIPATFSGILTLERKTSNVKRPTDTGGTDYRAALVDGKLQHTVCNVDFATAGPFSIQKSGLGAPTEEMIESPWGAVGGTTNDQGRWDIGDPARRLRCWDNWTGFIEPAPVRNLQDAFFKVMFDNAPRPPGWWFNRNLNFTHPLFQFPRSSSGVYDFSARNVPYLFAVVRGNPTPMTYRKAVTGDPQNFSTSNHFWQDVTPNYCSGGTALSSTRLMWNQLKGFDNATGAMRTVNGGSNTTTGNPTYGYVFMCTYGQYSPLGPTDSPP